MKTKRIISIKGIIAVLTALFSCFVLSGCNENGKIWARYCSESFEMLVGYEIEGEKIFAKVEVVREDGESTLNARFSYPEVLDGVQGSIDSRGCRINFNGLELDGDGAERLMSIPRQLAFAEASALGRAEMNGKKLIFAELESGKIYFDAELGELAFAELGGVRCEIIKFSWK